ncbi:tetratricopeptide repeat protein [Nostoc punctiforme]|uniref:TPR repeat-containing protein n=1 Tax=Nostoc punctiforme (strain ATCC 29133 / PCC 73102) TaxID=63737 RepID=B2JA22_NOSP7|nr:tetratricopeptide repeat protein [Nostoc punctiforme]ACC82699.1 TPR repeat-containing protein [Nostoc punctiforme PCC 73102]
MFNLLQPIVDFYINNKDFINNLLSGAFPAIVGVLWWLIWRHRQRRIPDKTFAFEVITPKSQDLMQRILGGKDDDPLADRNIVYQQRVPNRHICNELKRQLEEDRWILILGRTGLGKTREAAELAKHLNQEGWTVLYLKLGEWLDIPAAMPKEIGTNRKLLFFFDDLNQKMYASRHEISPEAEKSLAERFQVPLQERLLQALNKYEELCEPTEIRVIATARNETHSEDPGKPSPWEKLQWNKYSKLWNRFKSYELPQPEDDAIIAMLAATVSETDIKAEADQYPELARCNDSTFRNVVENFQRLQNESLPLTVNNYRHTLKDTWEKRYKKAVEKYSVSRYIYDAVDLLQQFDIPLYRFTVEPTARMLAAGNFWRRLWYYWQIRKATNYLISAERILEPRDGQIEAKPKQVEAGEYTLRFTRLILQLAEKHQEIKASLLSFSWNLINSKRYQDALRCLNKALTFTPDSSDILFAKGNALFNLGRLEEAIASYDQALNFKPDDHQAWYNRGIALFNLGRLEEAIASYDQALNFKPDDHQAWYNRGIALFNLGRLEEAIASYDQALNFKPDKDNAWNNRGIALVELGRLEEAIASYDQALNFKPDDHQAWYNRGIALFNLGRLEEAIASFDQALNFKPDYHEAWYNRGTALVELGRLEEAIASFDQAIKIKSDDHQAWNNWGYALVKLERLEEAIASFDEALKIKPDKDNAWYNKACCYGLLGNVDLAIENLQQSINLNPKYRETAKTDTDFDNIRQDQRFQYLISH